MNRNYDHSKQMKIHPNIKYCQPIDECFNSHRMKQKFGYSSVNTNNFYPTFNPSITINISTGNVPDTSIGLETAQYMAIAESGKTVYSNADKLKEYGSSDILDPDSVAYINLFINGVLQPPSLYRVEEGTLYLQSNDLPPAGAPIVLLFIIVQQ